MTNYADYDEQDIYEEEDYETRPTKRNKPMRNDSSDAISLKEWIITLLITFIPIVNIVMYFVWSFGSTATETKKNWAKASLIWIAVGFVISILFSGFITSMLASWAIDAGGSAVYYQNGY